MNSTNTAHGGFSPLDLLKTVAPQVGEADRRRFDEITAFLSEPAHLLFDPEEARRYHQRVTDARSDLLAILRRAEAREAGNRAVERLIAHFEGRDEE